MLNLTTIGKFLDQPLLKPKLYSVMPYLLVSSATATTTYQTLKAPKEKKKEVFTTNLCVTFFSAISSVFAVKKLLSPLPVGIVQKNITEKVNEYTKTHKSPTEIIAILEKSKNKLLDMQDISALQKFSIPKRADSVIDMLIQTPEPLNSKQIFSEISRLSAFGAIPIAGGILGGSTADAINGKKLSNTLPNKLKEGIYQFLANIFMCNIGAGVAILACEKLKIKSSSSKLASMLLGIAVSGVWGGNKTANKIGEMTDKLYSKNKKPEILNNGRKPELVDIALHVDDIATAGVLSGFQWVEPALPILYTLSAYRAGIGYRNKNLKKHESLKTFEDCTAGKHSRGDIFANKS